MIGSSLTFSSVTIVLNLARVSSHLPVEFLYSFKQVLYRLSTRGRTDKMLLLHGNWLYIVIFSISSVYLSLGFIWVNRLIKLLLNKGLFG